MCFPASGPLLHAVSCSWKVSIPIQSSLSLWIQFTYPLLLIPVIALATLRLFPLISGLRWAELISYWSSVLKAWHGAWHRAKLKKYSKNRQQAQEMKGGWNRIELTLESHWTIHLPLWFHIFSLPFLCSVLGCEGPHSCKWHFPSTVTSWLLPRVSHCEALVSDYKEGERGSQGVSLLSLLWKLFPTVAESPARF